MQYRKMYLSPSIASGNKCRKKKNRLEEGIEKSVQWSKIICT